MTAITRAAWAWWLIGVSGCSLLVDPGSFVIKCEVLPGRESEDPCLSAGLHCVASECQPCKGGTEICNGKDDDCDGVVDNGQDQDGDGFTWCGGLVRELADCVDSDPAIHPAGAPGPDGSIVPAPKEACDGKDNDCDAKVDEAPECAAMHSCVQDGCLGVQRCDEKTGVCIEPRPVGSGCKLDSECARGFCVHSGDFGLTALMDNRCASACCSDTDCAESGSVCVVLNKGARLCLPASIAGRAAKLAGDRCTRDAECASGACDRTRCAARCFSEATCGGTACYLSPGSLTEPRLWLCGDPQGLQPNGGTCLLLSCQSGFCTDRSICANPCGRSADCASDEICGYTVQRPSPLTFNQNSVAPACEPRPSTPSDRLCCTNADCAEGQLCSPKAVDADLWVMTCR